jgi:hypothetical protein
VEGVEAGQSNAKNRAGNEHRDKGRDGDKDRDEDVAIPSIHLSM